MEANIGQLVKDKKITDLKKMIDDFSKDSVPINESKPALTYMAGKMGDLDSASCT